MIKQSYLGYKKCLVKCSCAFLCALYVGTRRKREKYSFGTCNVWYGDKPQTKIILQGREPWSSGYGKRLTFQRSWVRFPVLYTGWTLFTLICSKNCKVCLKRPKINKKRGRCWPIFWENSRKKYTDYIIKKYWKKKLFYIQHGIVPALTFRLSSWHSAFVSSQSILGVWW